MTQANTLMSRMKTYRNWARQAGQQTGKSALQQAGKFRSKGWAVSAAYLTITGTSL